MGAVHKFFGWLDRMAELRSHDPWRDSSFGDIRAGKPNGLTLLNLAGMYLEEHGYYVRFYRNTNLMVVYNGWLRHKLHNRSKCVAFELYNSNMNTVWINPKNQWAPKTHSKDTVVSFDFVYNTRSLHYDGHKPFKTVGKISDPFCLESILKTTRNHFDKL